MNLEKNKKVYHIDIYDGNEQMKIIEITDTKVLLEGDYSGGTHNVSGRGWYSIEGIIIKGNCESNRIEIPPTFVKINLTIGKMYSSFYKEHYFYIYDDSGNVVPCDAFGKEKYFISLQKYREIKLNQLELT